MKTFSKKFNPMLLLLAVLSYFNPMQAQVHTGNHIVIHDAVAAPNAEAIVSMEVQNYDQFNGFQFDIPLPEGFSYVQGSAALNPARIINHLIQANTLPGTNIFRSISFSIPVRPFWEIPEFWPHLPLTPPDRRAAIRLMLILTLRF